MPIEMTVLHRDSKGSTRLLEPVLDRIRAMSHRFEGDADALVNDVWKCFAERSAFLGLWAGLDGEEVIGHMLAFIKQWDGQWVAWVTQLEVDRPMTKALREAGVAALEEWVEQFNFSFQNQGVRINDILMSTPHSLKAMRRLFGFEEYRSIGRRHLRPAPRKGATPS